MAKILYRVYPKEDTICVLDISDEQWYVGTSNKREQLRLAQTLRAGTFKPNDTFIANMHKMKPLMPRDFLI